MGTLLHGWALVEQGERDEGIAQIRQALEDCDAMEILSFSTYSLVLLSDAYSKDRQAREGLTVVGEALERAHKSGERLHEAELYRINGELLLMQGAAEPKVEECIHQALDIARCQQAKSLELRTVMSLSRLWQQQGNRDEARQMLSEIYGWFTEGFETADLKEAKILLEELA